eukprot:6197211-Pleurochrysis_carterae.AAC.1
MEHNGSTTKKRPSEKSSLSMRFRSRQVLIALSRAADRCAIIIRSDDQTEALRIQQRAADNESRRV